MKRNKAIDRWWLALFLAVLAVPLLINLVLLPRVNALTCTYVIQPLFWGALACCVRCLPRCRGIARRSWQAGLVKMALAIAGFQLYLIVVCGFLYKFGKSPNSFSVEGIIVNIFLVGTSLWGMESSRAWLINRLQRRPGNILPAVMALAYATVSLSWKPLLEAAGDLEKATAFVGSSFLPAFMEHLLASFLAMWGGLYPALAYRAVIQGFNWFCPLLPDLNWALQALTGTLVPLVGLAVLQQFLDYRLHPCRTGKQSGDLVSWAVMCAGAVIIIWFSLGVFPIRPVVIYSGSMRPTFEVGDIVVFARKNPARLVKGDVIAFRGKGSRIPTVHRIVRIEERNNKIYFTTKGDNNRLPDYPQVMEDNVVGKVVARLPKVGWASIALRQVFGSMGR